MNQKTSIDLVKYQKAMNFSAKKDVRYYLLGVCVQPCDLGGTTIVATDGHTLGAFHDPKGQCDEDEGLLLKLDKRDVSQWIKDGAIRATIERKTEGQVEITLYAKHNCNREWEIRKEWQGTGQALIDGRFPQWERVVPEELPETDQPLFNGMKVSNLEKFRFATRGDKEQAGIRMFPTGKNSAALIFVDKEPDFIGVLMPTKWTQDCKESWWLKLAKKRTQEALEEAA